MEIFDSTNPDIDEPPPSYPGSIGYHGSVINETGLYISEPPPSYPGITILNTGSGSPPPYPGRTAHQPSVVTELQPSRNESSPSHPAAGSSRAISQPTRVPPPTTVGDTRETSRVGNCELFLYFAICFLCGTPLTLFCTVPAILLYMKGHQYSSNGETVKAQKVLGCASMFKLLGIVFGIPISLGFYLVILPLLICVF